METVMEREYGGSRIKVTSEPSGTFGAAWWNPQYGGGWCQTRRGGFGFPTLQDAEAACIETIDEQLGEPQ